MYFVTLVTENRIHHFGRVVGADPCVCPIAQTNQDPCVCPIAQINQDPCVCPVETAYENDPHIQLNEIGNVILKYWQNISKQFPNVTLDKFVIMPNHIHGIIQINDNDWQTHGSAKSDGQTHGSAPTTISIPKIMQWFKTKTTNEYIRYVHAGICQPYEKRFWQRNYYEHIIRDDDDLNRIREYIQNNPVKWHEDELFSK